MYLVVCHKTWAACAHKICVFIANFDDGFAYNGEHAAELAILIVCTLFVFDIRSLLCVVLVM